MAELNRTTLQTQYTDYINRDPPFDTDPLIQKSEDLLVTTDLFDSSVLRQETVQSINNPGSLFNLDFSSVEQFQVNTSASVDNLFTATVQNLSPGQIGKMFVVKKANDTILFSNAPFLGVSQIQAGVTQIGFIIFNIGGVFNVIPNQSLGISSAINSNRDDVLATSEAVNNLRLNQNALRQPLINDINSLENDVDALQVDVNQLQQESNDLDVRLDSLESFVQFGNWTPLSLNAGISGNAQFRIMYDDTIQFRGNITYSSDDLVGVSPNGAIPPNYRSSIRRYPAIFDQGGAAGQRFGSLLFQTNGSITAESDGNATRCFFDGLILTPTIP